MSQAGLIPRFDRTRFEWEAAVRAMLATAIPLFTLFFLDRIDLGIYSSFAAFTALYGRSEPYRYRAVTLALAGIVLVACITGGVLIQAAGSPVWMLGAGFAVVVTVGVLLTSIMQWIPRGPIFFVFAFLGCATKPLAGTPVTDAILTAGIVVCTSWLIGMSGSIARRFTGTSKRLRALHSKPKRRIRDAWTGQNAVLIIVTVLLGASVYAIAMLIDVATHHYWAVVTVVAVFSSSTALVSFDRVAHRVIGTLLGVGIAAAIYGGAPHPLYVIIAVVICSFVTELIIGQHYGWALASITPLAIGATNLGLTTEWETLFVDRARETVLGGLACLVVILIVRAWWRRRGAELPA